MLIFVAAMVCDGYTIFSWKDLTTYNRVGVVWRLVTSAIMLVILIGYLCASRYRVTDTGVTFYLGILPISRVKTEKIAELRVLKKSEKLYLFYGEDTFVRIWIKPALFSAFADEVKARGARFAYTYDYEEEL